MNIRELIEDRVAGTPDKVYLYFEDQEITYTDFDRTINRMSNRMLDWGIQKGDRFAIHLSNCPEYLYTWFALNKIGAMEVPINVSLKGNEVQ
jgi:acyl-CoA synthetase (AMP-forming)/AMP-acid ligase II